MPASHCTLADYGSVLCQPEPNCVSCLLQVIIGQNAIMATPAMSALIRRRKLFGAPLCSHPSPCACTRSLLLCYLRLALQICFAAALSHPPLSVWLDMHVCPNPQAGAPLKMRYARPLQACAFACRHLLIARCGSA